MPYTVRCRGRALGTTELDFDTPMPGNSSGWFHPTPGAQRQIDVIAIGYPLIDWWLMRGETHPDGLPLMPSDFPTSRECEAISAEVAARLHFVLTLHRADGTELPTRDIVLQDRHYWPAPWIDDLDPYEGLNADQIAALDDAVGRDIALFSEWLSDGPNDSANVGGEDLAWDGASGTVSEHAIPRRYQVHVRLDDPQDIPSRFGRRGEASE